jgi:predicted nucleotidyltransferase
MTSTNLSAGEGAALQAYVNMLQERFGPRPVEVLLFGSKARNDARADSDVDVAVILHQPSAEDLSEARGLAFDIWLAYGVFLSVRAMSQQGWEALAGLQSLFYRHLKREGISLLSRLP